MQARISSELFQRAQQRIPGGVNSPVRAFKAVGGNPIFIKRAQGSRLYDVDGNEYLDYIGSWGAMILGHAHEQVTAALENTLRQGTSFGAPTAGEVRLAELINKAVPSVELVRLVNSGSEAAMAALRVARGYTGRDKIIKFEGCYHGSVDALLVKAGSGATTLGIPDSPGIPDSFTEHTLLAEFNNLSSVLELVEAHPEEIAGIILEPVAGNMGMIAPERNFLQGLRDLCDRAGILLIFYEVMTGFRVDFGGAQELFNIIPDLSLFGKVIGGGLPVGAYGGRQDIMLKVAPAGPVYQAGTLSGNPIAVAAGLATLELLKTENPYPELARKSAWLTQEFQSTATQVGLPLQTVAMGGMFGMFFSETPVRNYQDALQSNTARFSKFFQSMLQQGIYLAPSAFESLFLSTAHSDGDLERTAAAARVAFEAAA